MTASKVTLGTTGGLAIAAGAGYGSYKLLIPSLDDVLGGPFFKTLGYEDANNNKWKILTKLYKSDDLTSSKNKDIFNPNLGDDEATNIESFKSSCRNLLGGNSNSDEHAKQAIFWCNDFSDVRKFLLDRRWANLLSKDSSSEDWKNILRKADLKDGLKSFLGLADSTDSFPLTSAFVSGLQNRCSKALSTTPDQDDFETSLDNVRKYCVRLDS